MKSLLKISAVFCFAVVAATLSVANAEVLSDFEGGINDYDNTNPPAQGKFRDVQNGSYIDISENETGNNYLIFDSPNSGSTPPICVYDETPGNADPYTLFKVPVGITRSVSIDEQFTEDDDSSNNWGMGILDPVSTGSSRGVLFQFLCRKTGFEGGDDIHHRFVDDEGLGGTNIGNGKVDLDTDLGNSFARLSISVTNNGASATLGFQLDELDGLGGSVIDNVWSQSYDFDYGTGANELNMDLVNNGFEIAFYRSVHGYLAPEDIFADNLTISPIPEPSTLALLVTGLIGLLAYAWKKRK